MITETKLIHPNPYRDFIMDPLNGERLSILETSIKENGMWAGLPARAVPDTDPEEYEIAAGHHRLEVAKRLGITHIDLAVMDHTDENMVRIMVDENLTQRGNESFSAVLDAVAARIVLITRMVFSNDIRELSSMPDNLVTLSMSRIRNNLIKGDGIGGEALAKGVCLTARQTRTAVYILRKTSEYAELLRRGGAPGEVIRLYETEHPDLDMKAFTAFKKAAHANAFAELVMSPEISRILPVSNQINMAEDIRRVCGASLNAPLILSTGRKLVEHYVGKKKKEIEPDLPDIQILINRVSKTSSTLTNQLDALEEERKREGKPKSLWSNEVSFHKLHMLKDKLNSMFKL